MEEFFKMIPAKKYWALNSFFSTGTAKGRKYWDGLSSETNKYGMPERQPKKALKETADKAQKEGSKWWDWSEKQKNDIYGPRRKELDDEAANRMLVGDNMRKGKTDNTTEKDDTSMDSDAISAGLTIKRENPDDFIQNMSKLDNLLRIKTASDLPAVETNARGGAVDGASLIINLVKSFNATAGKSGKIYIDFKKLSEIVDRFPVDVFPEKPIKIKTNQGVMNAIKNHKAFVIPD
jgi:hypothetical protein